MQLFHIDSKHKTLYINSDAITKKTRTISEGLAYMKKPYEERIEESPYRDRIKEELAKYPDYQISEFIPGPAL